MNDLDKKFLQLLIDEDNYITIEDLTNILGCSRRTIYNSLARIESYLKDNLVDYKLDSKYSSGIKLDIIDRDFHIDNPEEDIIVDIFSDKPITMKYLMEKYYISYNRLSQIILDLNENISEYNIAIEIKQNSGVDIVGETNDVIIFKRDFLLQSDNISEYILFIFDCETIDKASRIANIIISKLKLDRKIKEILCIYVIYMLNIQGMITSDFIVNERSSYYQLAYTASKIYCEFNLDKKFEYVVKYFNEVFYKIEINNYLDISNFAKDNAVELIHDLKIHFQKIGDQIFDNDLNNSLSLQKHIEMTLTKLNKCEYIHNPLFDTIKNNYPYYYNEVIYVIDRFNSKKNIKIPPEEAAYVVIYIITMEKNNKKCKGVIVCNYGVGISHYLQSVLEENLTWIEFIEPININDYYQGDYKDYLVFSTLDLENNDYIKIPVFFDELDLKSISIKAYKKEYIQLFDGKLFNNNMNIYDKSEVIDYMVNKLEKLKYVEKGFKESVFYRESIDSTEIGDGLVLLHGNPKYILKSSISYMNLVSSIPWIDEEVKSVFLIAVKTNEYEKYNIKNFFKKLHIVKKSGKFANISCFDDLNKIFLE